MGQRRRVRIGALLCLLGLSFSKYILIHIFQYSLKEVAREPVNATQQLLDIWMVTGLGACQLYQPSIAM